MTDRAATSAAVPQLRPTASQSITLRLRLDARPGQLARTLAAIAGVGGEVGAIDLVQPRDGGFTVRDLTIAASDAAHAQALLAAVEAVEGTSLLEAHDRTFDLHRGGKIRVVATQPIRGRDDLSLLDAPGVARVVRAITADPARARELTFKRNAVAVVTDGTAVLGLGDIGPAAALPVMEGKAMLFKEFAGIDAVPICLADTDADRIVEHVVRIAPAFGGINLEDISAPRCFAIEAALNERLDIPVFHDDQHGTAIVILAALLSALRVTGRSLGAARIVVNGIGSAGVACVKILLESGATDIVACDRYGVLDPADAALTPPHRWVAEHTNPRGVRGQLRDAIVGADVFIGVSAPRLLDRAALLTMAAEPIVFAMANPTPEVMPEEAEGVVRVMATGRSDYPNQINNVLAFPGVFRGALDARAGAITEAMKIAAARAIADLVGDHAAEDYIIPSPFDRRVAEAVAHAVRKAA